MPDQSEQAIESRVACRHAMPMVACAPVSHECALGEQAATECRRVRRVRSLRGHLRSVGDRQTNDECRSFADGAFHPNATLVGIDDFFARCQTEAGSTFA